MQSYVISAPYLLFHDFWWENAMYEFWWESLEWIYLVLDPMVSKVVLFVLMDLLLVCDLF
jgi:hypothetical protein